MYFDGKLFYKWNNAIGELTFLNKKPKSVNCEAKFEKITLKNTEHNIPFQWRRLANIIQAYR